MSRLRNIPGSRERIAESRYVAQDPEQLRGNWRGYFTNGAPLFVEIGMGKGKFLLDMAAAHPENNYIGIEMYSSVLWKAVQRAERVFDDVADPAKASEWAATVAGRNFCFVRFDATEIETIFEPDEVDGIYLNFSDPWPKDRHAHRRLTSDRFLARYAKILAPGGHLEFKTDNTDLFEYSLEMLKESGWALIAVTRDLYGSSGSEPDRAVAEQLLAGNTASEYEEKFSAAGHPICKLTAEPPS